MQHLAVSFTPCSMRASITILSPSPVIPSSEDFLKLRVDTPEPAPDKTDPLPVYPRHLSSSATPKFYPQTSASSACSSSLASLSLMHTPLPSFSSYPFSLHYEAAAQLPTLQNIP
ncbi:hypothetical protein Pmani_025061 [Petrolisthes manimaculis]|uniref:Uncharacterized protein n=1 Tax=Petrolisthes manimaculis TaxID=1843537 RepID=A0AAE1P802_9EUCA|nr:hypothetical protein Pmani_025061 [Petrolisthes manimaculis]